MDVYKTHGAFSWSELTTSDPAAAASFYSQLFGWTVHAPAPEMGDYRAVSVGETMVAGIMVANAGSPPIPPHWGCYVTVDNLDRTVALAVSLGGQLLLPAMEVPTVGRMAVLRDPQGAVINVMQYNDDEQSVRA